MSDDKQGIVLANFIFRNDSRRCSSYSLRRNHNYLVTSDRCVGKKHARWFKSFVKDPGGNAGYNLITTFQLHFPMSHFDRYSVSPALSDINTSLIIDFNGGEPFRRGLSPLSNDMVNDMSGYPAEIIYPH